MPTLAVLGAINVDLVVSGAPLPKPGYTVTGGTFAEHHGGKGGNQAVAAARALGPGGSVVMLGAVGDDALGRAALGALGDEDVATYIDVLPGVSTGVALVAVDEQGQNQITVARGANARIDPDTVRAGLDEHRPSIVLISLEIPEEAARAAAEWGKHHGVPVVLNPAPMQGWVLDLLPTATYLTPNEGEWVAIGEAPPGVVVLETRGPHGVRIHEEEIVDIPSPDVPVVDTTGAGDTFNGVFAVAVMEGMPILEAAARAATAAALSVARAGARGGMPHRTEIDAAMRR
jgi:ribokinase